MSEELNFTIATYSDRSILSYLGQYVKQTRLAAGKTQNFLAKEAGVNRTTLISLEQGEGANLLSFIQIIRALGKLELFKSFKHIEEPSPMMLAERMIKMRKRAPRQKQKQTPPPLDW